jgi:hypothetical protein
VTEGPSRGTVAFAWHAKDRNAERPKGTLGDAITASRFAAFGEAELSQREGTEP